MHEHVGEHGPGSRGEARGIELKGRDEVGGGKDGEQEQEQARVHHHQASHPRRQARRPSFIHTGSTYRVKRRAPRPAGPPEGETSASAGSSLSAARQIRSHNSGNSIPAAPADWGMRLVRVIPGRVFTSKQTNSPSAVKRKSTRE